MPEETINSYIANVLSGGSFSEQPMVGGLFGSLMDTFAESRQDTVPLSVQGGGREMYDNFMMQQQHKHKVKRNPRRRSPKGHNAVSVQRKFSKRFKRSSRH